MQKEWEQRLSTLRMQGDLRGSLAPNWKPMDQQDLTATGSVNMDNWRPGTTQFQRPGTTSLADVRAMHDRKVGVDLQSPIDIHYCMSIMQYLDKSSLRTQSQARL